MRLRELGITYGGLSGKSGNDFGVGERYVPYVYVYTYPGVENTTKINTCVSIAKNERQNPVQYGDVLFTTSSETPEEVGISSVLLDKNPGELYLNSFCFGFRLHDFNALLPEFAKFYFRTDAFRKQMFRIAQGATRYNLSKRHFLDTAIKIPDTITEQRRIVKVLETWDAYIEKLEQKITLKKNVKKGLIQQLLTPGKRRLPGFSGAWEEKQLGALFVERADRASGQEYNLLSITRENGIVRQDTSAKRDISNSDKSNYKIVHAGDIAYNTMRMWQGASGVSSFEGIVSPAYTVVTLKEYKPKFFGYLFKTLRVIFDFYRYSQGLTSDTWNLKFKHFSEVRVFIPVDAKEQEAIADVLTAADAEIETLEKKLALVREQKKYLLNNLVTEEIRVPEDI